MTYQNTESVVNYLELDRSYRIAHARWVEEQRRYVTTRGKLLRQAIDDTNIATMTDAANVSTSRLYQLMDIRGRKATAEDPATPLDARLDPVSGSQLSIPTSWGVLRTKLVLEHSDMLLHQWFTDWQTAFSDAGLDPDTLDHSHLHGRFDRWWFHLAPQTIEAGLRVRIH